MTEGLVWIVDPLDGTTNFLHGFPSYAVSIAAAVDGVLEAGVVLDVSSRTETYTAVARRRRVARASAASRSPSIGDPAFALIGTGFPFKRHRAAAGVPARSSRRVARATSGIRRPGAAALDLADVAAGRFDGFWEQQLSAWDIAAGVLLIREAGGVVTDFSGREVGSSTPGSWREIRRYTGGCWRRSLSVTG